MSVLIKGISMPKEPWDCPCHDGETGRCKVTASSCFPIPKDCPLVEVSTSHETEGRMMSDLISRQDAIDALCDDYCGGWKNCRFYPKCQNLEIIQNLPSAHKKGEWIKDSDTAFYWKCSECGAYLFWRKDDYLLREEDEPNFCPNCGADMRVE